jgi:beta-mannosidase
MRLELTAFELAPSTGDQPPPDGWVPAVVPGGVHESLLAAGLIGHPYVDENETAIRWVEERTWWYRTTFAGVDGPAVLRFDCLDTVAEVRLNGQVVGAFRNQHRPHEVDVSGLLEADNELLVRFPPPLDGLLTPDEEEVAIAATLQNQARIRPGMEPPPRDELILPSQRSRVRKSTFSWGWDFAARVPSLGIAGPVTLLVDEPAPLEVQVRTVALDVAARTATVTVSVDAEDLRVVITAPDGTRTEASTPGASVDLSLTDVQPWWTHDLGNQPLYGVSVTAAGQTTDLRIGVRTIAIDRTAADGGGAHFRFLLNGQPLFARGANWVPPSLLTGSIDPTVRTGLVDLAVAAGMNMIRMWGGGVYEPDDVYDRCDELGVLVWQDFMFACYDYPDPTGDLARETRIEAEHQVKRLRHHPSLALWCGNNEVQGIREINGRDLATGDWGRAIFHEVLPAVTAELDPTTPYWPGSPWGETPGEIVNGVSDGDRHAWEVWHGALDIGAGVREEFPTRGEAVHFARYEDDEGRFISEFGIHAAPELTTLQRWTSAHLDVQSPAMLHRIKDTPKDKGFALIEHEAGTPASVQQYVDFSMACQAEGLKLGVEHYRRRQPVCSGTLVWQLNDSWPGLSWSVIDYDLVPKAGYYFLQRAYATVLASFRTGDDGLELWVTNSGAQDVDLDLAVDLGGIQDPVRREELSVRSEAYSSVAVWRSADVPSDGAWVSGAGVPDNRRFFRRLKELPLLDGRLETSVTRTGSTATVDLRAGAYTYLTRVMSSAPGARFSQNYLDLRPGDERRIEVTGLTDDAVLTVASYGGRVWA